LLTQTKKGIVEKPADFAYQALDSLYAKGEFM